MLKTFPKAKLRDLTNLLAVVALVITFGNQNGYIPEDFAKLAIEMLTALSYFVMYQDKDSSVPPSSGSAE